MTIVCLQGSPRRNGSTSKMLSWVGEALEAEGHQVEHIHVAEKDISGCMGCYACQQDPEELICAVEDDGLPILERLAAADAVIYGTPLYCWDFSGQIKPLIDRHLCLVTGFTDPATHRSYVEGKTAALLVTCGGPVGEGNTDCISMIWQRFTQFGKCGTTHELIVPGCMGPSPLGDEQKALAIEFAGKIVAG